MARLLNTSDSKIDPEGFASSPAVVCLQSAAQGVIAMSAAVFAVITDADMWVGGTLLASPLASAGTGGFVISETAGTITCTRAMNVRISYFISGITVINGSTRESAIFGGSAGTTRLGGTALATDLTAAPSTLAGQVLATVAVGDVLSIKAIESGAGNMTIAAKGATFNVEEI